MYIGRACIQPFKISTQKILDPAPTKNISPSKKCLVPLDGILEWDFSSSTRGKILSPHDTRLLVTRPLIATSSVGGILGECFISIRALHQEVFPVQKHRGINYGRWNSFPVPRNLAASILRSLIGILPWLNRFGRDIPYRIWTSLSEEMPCIMLLTAAGRSRILLLFPIFNVLNKYISTV